MWLLFVTAGLGTLVVSSRPLTWFLPFLALTLLLAVVIYRKKPGALRRSLAAIVAMGLLVGYSLV